MKPLFRVVIAEDEPLSRERVRTLLADEPDMVLCGECEDGDAAYRVIRAERPDIVILDVQMPGLDGVSLAAAIADTTSAIIFVTAHHRYALAAFDLAAVDYLLKPFDRARFSKAIARVRERLQTSGRPEMAAMTVSLDAMVTPLRSGRLSVKDGVRTRYIEVRSIDDLASAGNYVVLTVGTEELVFRATLADLASRLRPYGFVRVHRGHVVNPSRVREVVSVSAKELQVILESGRAIPMSRQYAPVLERALTGQLA